MPLTRRALLTFSALMGAAAIFLSIPWASPARAAEPTAADLAKPSELGDLVLGTETAPVTIIEYASMTCTHCAHFAKETFPKLKSTYIDTGKVRYVLREFPLDPLSAAGFLVARCAAKGDKIKYYTLIEVLFAQQKDWVVEKPLEPLKKIAMQAGLNEASFEACLSDSAALKKMQDTRNWASDKLGVNATPTFFINGKKEAGALSFEEMQKLIDPLLKG